MTCILEAVASPVSVGDSRFSHPKRPIGFASQQIPLNRNTFTVSHSSIHPDRNAARDFLDKYAPRVRPDMDCQRVVIQKYRLSKLREFFEKSKAVGVMGDEERVIAVKCLVLSAAERAVHNAIEKKYPPNIICHIRRTWQMLLQQVHHHFSEIPLGGSHDDETVRECRWREALESLSSMGLWYMSEMAIPFRRYVLRMPTSRGTVEDVFVIGYVSFAYSSYIMDSCHKTQVSTLSELCRLSREVGENIFFLSSTVVPAKPLRGGCDYLLNDESHGQTGML